MNVLVINCGSSSLKYQVIDIETEAVLAKGLCERIGLEMGRVVYQPAGCEKIIIEEPLPDHEVAVKFVLEALTNKDHGILKSLDEIGAIGHRVVHGGEALVEPTLLSYEAIKKIEDCCSLAPLHNPANVIGIKVCGSLMPGKPMVAVFDTAFHSTLPKKAYLYGIPYEYYTDLKIRKYGFHGISHQYVSQKTADMLGKDYNNFKSIICHLGNGASITAVKDGKSVDTSMGFTPLAGLVMGTRCGEIDPSIVEYIVDNTDMNIHAVTKVLNKKSGMYGITGGFTDFRDIEEQIANGNEACELGLDIFCYHVATTIGAYCAVLNGTEAITFTAGIGENDDLVREKVCSYLGYLGVNLDTEANKLRGDDRFISTPDSKVPVLVIPTNEELMIAKETYRVVNK